MFSLFSSSSPSPSSITLSVILQLPGGSRKLLNVTGTHVSAVFDAAARALGARPSRVLLAGAALSPSAPLSSLSNLCELVVEEGAADGPPEARGGAAASAVAAPAAPTASAARGEEETCAICLEGFLEAGEFAATRAGACVHVFHATPCLAEWRSRSSVCPLCRAPMGGVGAGGGGGGCAGGAGAASTSTMTTTTTILTFPGGGGSSSSSGVSPSQQALLGAGATAAAVAAMLHAARSAVQTSPGWAHARALLAQSLGRATMAAVAEHTFSAAAMGARGLGGALSRAAPFAGAVAGAVLSGAASGVRGLGAPVRVFTGADGSALMGAVALSALTSSSSMGSRVGTISGPLGAIGASLGAAVYNELSGGGGGGDPALRVCVFCKSTIRLPPGTGNFRCGACGHELAR
jgi:hypothetical protein